MLLALCCAAIAPQAASCWLRATKSATPFCCRRAQLHHGLRHSRVGMLQSRRSDDNLFSEFEAGTLPFCEWTHEAHLRAAFGVARREIRADAALMRMSTAIKAYNRRHIDRVNTGYHETITRWWMEQIVEREPWAYADFASFAEQHPYLLNFSWVYEHYDQEVLFSNRAKREWVPPTNL